MEGERNSSEFLAFRSHYTELVKGIQQPEHLAVELYSGGILPLEAMEQIQASSNSTTLERSRILLSVLESQIAASPNNFQGFLRTLRKNSVLRFLATRLEEAFAAQEAMLHGEFKADTFRQRSTSDPPDVHITSADELLVPNPLLYSSPRQSRHRSRSLIEPKAAQPLRQHPYTPEPEVAKFPPAIKERELTVPPRQRGRSEAPQPGRVSRRSSWYGVSQKPVDSLPEATSKPTQSPVFPRCHSALDMNEEGRIHQLDQEAIAMPHQPPMLTRSPLHYSMTKLAAENVEVGELEFTEEDLPQLMNSLMEVAPQWRSLGNQLHFSPGTLDLIEANNAHECVACLRDLLVRWIRRQYPPLCSTLRALLGALRSPEVCHVRLAMTVEQTFRVSAVEEESIVHTASHTQTYFSPSSPNLEVSLGLPESDVDSTHIIASNPGNILQYQHHRFLSQRCMCCSIACVVIVIVGLLIYNHKVVVEFSVHS